MPATLRGLTKKEFKRYPGLTNAGLLDDWWDKVDVQLALQGSGRSDYFKAAQVAFPTASTTIISKIIDAVFVAASSDAAGVTSLLNLLSSPNTDIWDLQSRELQFQDNAQTQPITADGQAVQSIRPLLGGRTMTARSGLSLPTSDQNNGLNFPNSIAVMDFPEKQLRTAIMIFNPRNPNPSDLDPSMFLLGSTLDTPFGPGYGTLLFYASGPVTQGRILLNDAVVAYDVAFPTGVSRLRVQSTGLVSVDSIAADRIYQGAPYFRTFYGNYRFLLLSETVFSDGEIALLNAFAKAYSSL